MHYKFWQACVTNWGSYYKLGQPLLQNRELLQIGAGITNKGNYYKLGHNRVG